MSETNNDITNSIRFAFFSLMNQILADVLELQMHLKNAQWKLNDPNFAALHKLFDKVAMEVIAHSDTISERISKLGELGENTALDQATLAALSKSRFNG